MALARCIVVALLMALVVAAGAQAAELRKPRTTVVVKRTKGAAAVDGSRYAAWAGAGGRLAVLDERSGSRDLFDLGRECDHVLPLSGSGGAFLVNCSVTGVLGVENHQYILRARSGSAELIDGTGFAQLGRQWLQGSGEDRFGRFLVYTNWHTGETITEGAAPRGGTRVPYDLDSGGLDAVAPPAGDAFVVGGAHALERVGREVHLVGWDGDTTLHRCAHACAPLSLKGGLALWNDGDGRLYGYALASGRRFAWRVPDAAEFRGSTGKRVYYLTPLALDPQYFALKSFRWR
jgi:hypothetical protein